MHYVPLSRPKAIAIALRLYQAVDDLLDLEEVSMPSVKQVNDAATELHERTYHGIQLTRVEAMRLALACLEACNEIERMHSNLGLALDLIDDHDYLMGLIDRWTT